MNDDKNTKSAGKAVPPPLPKEAGKDDTSLAARATRQFEQQLLKATATIKRPNVLLVGRSGAGKSTLVNTVFGSQLAAVGGTRPVTKGFTVYGTENVPVNIIDSAGYELGNEAEFSQALNKYVADNFDDLAKQIHLCWYCISVGTNRVTAYDLANLRHVQSKGIPVAVVLTQCDLDTPQGSIAAAMTEVIEREFDAAIPVFQVSADKELACPLDLEKLISWSTANLPQHNLRLGFIAAQRISLKEKDKAAEARIAWYAAGAAGIGATPMPCSDSVLLTGLQMKMSADIYAIYGLGNTLGQTVQDFIKGRLAGTVGRMLAGNLAKIIPGGAVVGSAINASVASSITYALGRAVAALCRQAVQSVWAGKESDLDKIFEVEALVTAFNKFRHKI